MFQLKQKKEKKKQIGYGASTIATISSLLQVTPKDCYFCSKSQNMKQSQTIMIKKALYSKYSASQNYFYTKEIDSITKSKRCSIYIVFKDYSTWDESEEYLQLYYPDNKDKLFQLGDYYRYHRDVPRIFQMPVAATLNKYHDKKRKIEYVRITNMLKIEKGESIKHIANQDPYLSLSNKMLDGIFTEMSLNTINMHQSPDQPSNTLKQLKQELSDVVADPTYYPSFTNQDIDQLESYFYKAQGKQKPEVKKGEVMQLYKMFIQKHETKKTMLRKINLDDESSQKIKEQPINQFKENKKKSIENDPIKKILTYRQMCQQSNIKSECKQKIQEAEKNFFQKLIQYQKQNEEKKVTIQSQNIINKNLQILKSKRDKNYSTTKSATKSLDKYNINKSSEKAQKGQQVGQNQINGYQSHTVSMQSSIHNKSLAQKVNLYKKSPSRYKSKSTDVFNRKLIVRKLKETSIPSSRKSTTKIQKK